MWKEARVEEWRERERGVNAAQTTMVLFTARTDYGKYKAKNGT